MIKIPSMASKAPHILVPTYFSTLVSCSASLVSSVLWPQWPSLCPIYSLPPLLPQILFICFNLCLGLCSPFVFVYLIPPHSSKLFSPHLHKATFPDLLPQPPTRSHSNFMFEEHNTLSFRALLIGTILHLSVRLLTTSISSTIQSTPYR